MGLDISIVICYTAYMSFLIIKPFPRQGAYQHVKSYKSRSGANEFLAKNPDKGYAIKKVGAA